MSSMGALSQASMVSTTSPPGPVNSVMQFRLVRLAT
jgi:hypothetical protein